MPFMVWNNTDEIYAHPEPFVTEREAKQFMADFPKRFERQGYYLTSRLDRIQVADIDLSIRRVPKSWLDEE